MNNLRRRLLALLPLLGLPQQSPAAGGHAAARPEYRMTFPRDHGSHPEHRIEWWYATGWLGGTAQPDCGFQITFFRVRPQTATGNPSRFSPEHIIIAHAAIADAKNGRLVHAQRMARQGFGLAGSDHGNTRVWVDGWQLLRDGDTYRSRISSPELELALDMTATQAPLLQGVQGYSRKGPGSGSASHYYSLPHLQVSGTLRSDGRLRNVRGSAWLDHEWSSSYLDAAAAGWDWVGINLDDGGALMAFRIRDRQGGVFWAGGAHRDARGRVRNFNPDEIRFTPLRRWRSPRTGAEYPVAFTIRAGGLEFRTEPLMDDQENDTRATTGAVYWEGASAAFQDGRLVGRGYLELTGYVSPLRL